ncbi:MAG TPA: hypothetical protein VHK64_06230 [Nocardioidaceae bacterium]|nr:hypothetical protein [Nocardioidaceae bacterium]
MTVALTALVWALVIAGAAAWIVSGVALALMLGRVIRNADRQVPRDRR